MTDLKPLLEELMRDLRHPQVRDLAWTLLSPSLLQPGSPSLRHPLSATGWYREPTSLATWLRQQERAPERLLTELGAAPRQRLGRYYERLWQYALAQAPDLRLLAANLPVRENGHTLGELDLLLEDDEGLHHVELAIKLYLGPSPAGPDTWLGPGAEDHLLRKIEHFYQHQLPLSTTPEGLSVVRTVSDSLPSAEFWLGGYLFYPWPEGCSAPARINCDHLRGRWLHRRDWPDYRRCAAPGWRMLPRSQWLAPAAFDEQEQWSEQDFDTWLKQLPEDGFPQMLVRLARQGDRWLEEERLFLVGDRWPQVHSGYTR
ncbi:DUF1853 family protein [Pseudomonas sp. ZM23]|uniref:DUF1853 family protein n=1 Tax=Pseudomonas triclosanedens TaxID=2961893 RepID=A0ABY6ZTA2_9PSED|nr:DUF1853 family protein [Pseudomonas triclosanedens]MCP8466617.1 DUF1853 family protein [Pseudomonas triclosanedens]MCP8472028.1 DUF1853 family protein [Pseudomonas triclosanedens]MCP8474588.1 DUF1853 family protein [Pseudomonas triclosanedens]WAI48036.1 DUF1853 family protein [Pseudomonas triclosanedens]